MTPYPLTRKLAVRIYDQLEGPHYIYAADLERLLEQAIVVYGAYDKQVTQPFGEVTGYCDTHRALLIAIEPIKQEGEDRKLLREFINWVSDTYIIQYKGDKPDLPGLNDIVARAKALLAKDEPIFVKAKSGIDPNAPPAPLTTMAESKCTCSLAWNKSFLHGHDCPLARSSK